jgi:hypothetical protein
MLLLFFLFLCPACSFENYGQIWRAIFLYPIHASIRLLGTGTGHDVCGMFDVENFPEFLHTGFVFAIDCLCECSKCTSNIVNLDVAKTSWSDSWRNDMLGGRRTFVCLGGVSISGRYPGAYPTKMKH